jgi:hypothetical protein
VLWMLTVPKAPGPPTSIARWGQMAIVSRQSDTPAGRCRTKSVVKLQRLV